MRADAEARAGSSSFPLTPRPSRPRRRRIAPTPAASTTRQCAGQVRKPGSRLNVIECQSVSDVIILSMNILLNLIHEPLPPFSA